MFPFIAQSLAEVNIVSTLLRMALAVLCGGLLGIDRGRKKRPAGFRTYIVVCLGSTLVMLVNQYVFQVFNTADPTRIAAQVISGIGFLGAGTIIVTSHSQVKGLTTAAGLWASAAIGLALGIGFYYGALIATVFIFVVMNAFGYINSILYKHSKIAHFYIEMDVIASVSKLLAHLGEKDLQIKDFDIFRPQPNQPSFAVRLTVQCDRNCSFDDLMKWILELDGVIFVEEV